MDQDPNAIREEIEQTRAEMTAKIALIENTVRGAIDDTQSTVVEVTEKVKRQFDLRQHIRERPWRMLAISVASGALIGVASRQRRY
jgi:ElaB/YqjD/DUF883 family membrane-anchored ribosome-binding protein